MRDISLIIKPCLVRSSRVSSACTKPSRMHENSRYSGKKQDSLASHGTRYVVVDTNEMKFRIEKLLPSALNRDFHAVEIVLTRVRYPFH